MKRLQLILIVFGLGICIIPVHADFLFSSEEGFRIGASNFSKYDVISTNGSGAYTAVYTSLSAVLPPNVNIDALHSVAPSSLVFSLGEDAIVQGTLFHKQDLIQWNGSNATLLWDGMAHGLPQNVNLDAVYIISLSPLEFSFSLEEDINLAGVGPVSKSDLIHYLTGSGFTGKDFDAVARGIPSQVNLDALARVAQSVWLVSFDVGSRIPGGSGTLFSKADLVNYNPITLTFNSTPFFNAYANGIPTTVNLDAADFTSGQITGVEYWELYRN